ncbi:hypothetical protein PF008_g20070 [Phytophthora fragariae]|uniref:Uncharacterized protein n=1 Tax=Phytophthora fragariae TaxID=53985 RepID=A0A6G0R1M5_9STRA|nr:hypothetical protein PF008_g20070 [Phytophthora fragariae]
MGCPHASCVRIGRVTLLHIFWTCPSGCSPTRVSNPTTRGRIPQPRVALRSSRLRA